MNPHLLEKVNFFSIENPLLKFSKNITSQFGEDGIIEKIFETISSQNQYCVELGGWDGQHLSNCFNLISNQGWSGGFIEANKDKFQDLVHNHGTNPKVMCINQFVEITGENTLDNILHSMNAPKNLDLLSIDVDGMDYFLWGGLTSYAPNLVVIEFNPSIPNDVIFVQEKASHVHQGASLLALIILGKTKGYELICCTACNAFFVKSEDYPKFHLKSNSILTMYQPLLDGRIFQGYDSHIYVHGMDKLLWSSMPLNSDLFQVIPENERNFSDAQFADPPKSFEP